MYVNEHTLQKKQKIATLAINAPNMWAQLKLNRFLSHHYNAANKRDFNTIFCASNVYHCVNYLYVL